MCVVLVGVAEGEGVKDAVFSTMQSMSYIMPARATVQEDSVPRQYMVTPMIGPTWPKKENMAECAT